MYLLLTLKRAGCDPKLLYTVYCSCIRPILLYPFPVFCNLPQNLSSKLLSVEKRALRIIDSGDYQPSLFTVADKMCKKIFSHVVSDPSHPLRQFFMERKCVSFRNNCPLRRPKMKIEELFILFY